MPSITRRRLLAAGTALTGGGYAGYRLFRGRADAKFETWMPEPGTWPLPRYDPANTSHNPHARPPRDDPSRERLLSVEDKETALHPLVGRSRFVCFGPGLSTMPRDGGDVTSITDARIRHAGLDPDGRIHAVTETDLGEFETVSYEGTTAAHRVSLGSNSPDWFTLGTTEVYSELRSGTLVAVDSGSREWRVAGGKPALAEGRLYSVSASGIAAFTQRTGLDRRVTAGPKRVWASRAPRAREIYEPAVADGRLVVGTFGPFTDSGAVAGYDAATGEQLWESQAFGSNVGTPALSGDRGFATVFGEPTSDGRVLALDLATGDVLWRDDPGWHALNPAVGGDTLVVVGQLREDGEATAGRVRGYDTASGEVLWTERFEEGAPVRPAVALVEDRILVTSGGALYELT